MLRPDHLFFLGKRSLMGFNVPTKPHFGKIAATDWFVSALEDSSRYLEYGSGGSTYLVAKLGIPFVAVDSDRCYLDSVREKIHADGFTRPSGQVFRYADIGLTGKWGRPIGPFRSKERQEQFRRYSDAPSESVEGGDFPDLVLVDGRFRVACVLKALRLLAGQKTWTIAVDDYVSRPEYHAITEFAIIDECISNRVAVIRSSTKDLDKELLDRAIAHYEVVPD